MLSVRTWFAAPIVLLAAVLAACSAGPPTGTASAGPATDAGKPQVVIESPPGNAQVTAGQAVEVVTTAVDGVGIGRIDLRVDGLAVSSAETPLGGLPSFSALHIWVPSSPGEVALSAVAYRTDGAPSDPVSIAILVLPAGSSAAPYATYSGAVPTYHAEPVASNYAPPSYAPTYVAGPTPTYRVKPTPTDAAAATPTYAANPTATYVATPTDVAATPTTAPTTAPSTQVLTWKIPYQGGASNISDAVSVPGDIDRVNFEVTGMNSTPPGNTGHLTIFGSCSGTGTESVRFLYGQASYPCNTQFVTDVLITNESNTGAVRVTVIGTSPVNVTWTLTGQATP
jgi:hypothetical protein